MHEGQNEGWSRRLAFVAPLNGAYEAFSVLHDAVRNRNSSLNTDKCTLFSYGLISPFKSRVHVRSCRVVCDLSPDLQGTNPSDFIFRCCLKAEHETKCRITCTHLVSVFSE